MTNPSGKNQYTGSSKGALSSKRVARFEADTRMAQMRNDKKIKAKAGVTRGSAIRFMRTGK